MQFSSSVHLFYERLTPCKKLLPSTCISAQTGTKMLFFSLPSINSTSPKNTLYQFPLAHIFLCNIKNHSIVPSTSEQLRSTYDELTSNPSTSALRVTTHYLSLFYRCNAFKVFIKTFWKVFTNQLSICPPLLTTDTDLRPLDILMIIRITANTSYCGDNLLNMKNLFE